MWLMRTSRKLSRPWKKWKDLVNQNSSFDIYSERMKCYLLREDEG
jgi:hypothetical protein